MSDQNRIDECLKNYLHYWDILLAACGKFIEKLKNRCRSAAAFLCRYAKLAADQLKKAWEAVSARGKQILRKLAAWLLKVRGWVRQKWDRGIKPVLQKMAAWLLMVREKADPGIQKVKGWFAGVKERFASLASGIRQRLPSRPKELPPAEPSAAAAALPAVQEDDLPDAVEIPNETPADNADRWSGITNPTLRKILTVLAAIGKYLKLAIKWIWKLRTIFMAIPVVWAAVKLAMQNLDRLPDSVGLDIQTSGEFAHMITRTEAVVWPLGITAFCLVLMFCSKKPLLPWVISIFTLVLPVMIWVLNYYA